MSSLVLRMRSNIGGIETKRSDLLKIRNFGVKSFNELNDKFGTMGFLPEGFVWGIEEGDEIVDEENQDQPASKSVDNSTESEEIIQR